MAFFEEGDGSLREGMVAVAEKQRGTQSDGGHAPHPGGLALAGAGGVNAAVAEAPGGKLVVLVEEVKGFVSVGGGGGTQLSEDEQREDTAPLVPEVPSGSMPRAIKLLMAEQFAYWGTALDGFLSLSDSCVSGSPVHQVLERAESN
jgi:hypothetical protein